MRTLLIRVFIFFPFLVFAQNSSTLKIGVFNPQVTEAGLIVGYENTRPIDERLEVGWSFDWYNKTYVDKKLVNEFNNNYPGEIGEVNELRAKTNMHIFPLLSAMRINFPIDHRTAVYLIGNLGLDFLLVYYRNFQKPDEDDWQLAADFAWRLGGGLRYKIGSRSDLFLELNYHKSEPSWEYEVKQQSGFGTTTSTKVFERSYDVSGIMARIGIKYFY